MSTPRRVRQEARIIAVASAAPGWVARFVDDRAENGIWVQAVPVWALMQDAEGHTWVAGIDVIGEGPSGRPCDEMSNFYDYVFRPDWLPMPGEQPSTPAESGT